MTLAKEYQDMIRRVDKLEKAYTQGNANKQQLKIAQKQLEAKREEWRAEVHKCSQ